MMPSATASMFAIILFRFKSWASKVLRRKKDITYREDLLLQVAVVLQAFINILCNDLQEKREISLKVFQTNLQIYLPVGLQLKYTVTPDGTLRKKALKGVIKEY